MGTGKGGGGPRQHGLRGWPHPCSSPPFAGRKTGTAWPCLQCFTGRSLCRLVLPARLIGATTSALFNLTHCYSCRRYLLLHDGGDLCPARQVLPMAAAFTIPRFLLPQSGLIWRRVNLGNRLRDPEVLVVRYASAAAAAVKKPKAKDKDKPVVLAKPDKFNPPSHGARLPRKNRPQQQHYGGALSGDEVAAQRKRDYPGLPPPPDTWAHWFLNSRMLHMSIAMVSRALQMSLTLNCALSPLC